MSLPALDFVHLKAAYADGLDPRDLVRAVYQAIAAANDPGIFIHLVDLKDALAAAATLGRFDATKSLYGVPFVVKDNIDVADMPTTAACPEFAYTPARSATVVERLLAAGAILIGKTNLDQFATGLVGVRTPYPVPRNACDPTLVPGGSSSGSAVAVALGLVSFSLGTDTAGSGRVPAALNNIVGLKPSKGMISTRGVVPACRTLDCVSVFARSVEDAGTVLAIAAAFDAEDPYSRHFSASGHDGARPRIGIPDAATRILGGRFAEGAFDAALGHLATIDPTLRPMDLSVLYETAALLYEGAWVAERYAAIGEFIKRKPDAAHPVTRRIVEGANGMTAVDAFRGQYRLAELKRRSEAIWDKIDVLAVPSIPDICTLADIADDPIGPNSRLGTYTNFVNLLDMCALAVPGPFRVDGRPAGITLIAPAGREELLAKIGSLFHRAAGVPIGATGVKLPAAVGAMSAGSAATIEIAVVGAHLSGMPLNRELVALGGAFVRKVSTAAEYRLFALPGGPPYRPGMVRVKSGGAAIETEVWALPPAGFGMFVAAIPAPLSIGMVRLADGTSVKGFLCEAVATDGARDISTFGGWRAFMAQA